MTFTDEQLLPVKLFCQSIIEKPRPIFKQPHTKSNGFFWCEDWELIEICKYIFNGHEGYLGDPPPNRLKDNPLWSKDDIVKKGQDLLQRHENLDSLIAELRSKRNAA